MIKPSLTKYLSTTVAIVLLLQEAPVAAQDYRSDAEPAATEAVSDGPEASNDVEEGALALLDVPLEDLLTQESTSVAKKRQKVSESAAAVYVVTQDEIRRSAASTIADLLRIVPGVEVGHLANGLTAVSIRGFNSRISSSLLVMVDGRSIYNSAASSVFWDQLLLPITNIERIEVVRGPGAALWGANAVNGVINIITKHSSDTLGTAASARVGTRSQEGSISHGARLSDDLSFRAHAHVRRDDGLVNAEGEDWSKQWKGFEVGTRIDWQPTIDDALTLSGDYTKATFETPFLELRRNPLDPQYDLISAQNGFTAYNVLGRWAHQHSDQLDWSVQVYHSYLTRAEPAFPVIHSKVLDADFGIHWSANETHDISAGVSARQLKDEGVSTVAVTVTRMNTTDRWLSGYLQDDISLVGDDLRLTLGAKLERNNFTGFEFQPSARLFLRADEHLALWGAISRAVRTPSLLERVTNISLNVLVPGTPENPLPIPVYPRSIGMPDKPSEVVIAYEAGLRADLAEGWSIDVAAYYNKYDRLLALVPAGFEPIFIDGFAQTAGLYANLDFASAGHARTWGAEFLIEGQITSRWRMEASYSHFNHSLGSDLQSGTPYDLANPLEGSPKHQLGLRNYAELTEEISLDTQLRHVSQLLNGEVPAYTALDARLTYRPLASLELSLIGEGLLGERRLEFSQYLYPIPPSYVARALSAEVRYRF